MIPSPSADVNDTADDPPTVAKFYESEDRLAQNLTNEQIVGELTSIVDFMRSQIADGDGEMLANDPAARDALLLKAVMLRRLNRLSNFRNRLLRKRLAASRVKVDAHYLQLQNLRCGISHLRAITTACLEFRSLDNNLDVVPVEEFRQRASEAAAATEDNEHRFHLARLNFELEERKIMQGNLQELEGRRSVLISDIRGKESRLRQVRLKIAALKQSVRPLLDILDMKSVDVPTTDVE